MLALFFSTHPSTLAAPSAPPALPLAPPPPPPRLAAVDRALLLDGAPWLMRGVAYAPTPVGVAPGPTQSLDFFSGGSERNVRTFERDLPLLAAMGANALRVYHFDWGGGQSHARFFNACAAHNITVMGGFELHAHPDSAHSLNTTAGLAAARAALTAQLRNLAPPGANRTFPAATLWSVGNELNAPFNRFVCDDDDGDGPRNSGAILAHFWRTSGAILAQFGRNSSEAPPPPQTTRRASSAPTPPRSSAPSIRSARPSTSSGCSAPRRSPSTGCPPAGAPPPPGPLSHRTPFTTGTGCPPAGAPPPAGRMRGSSCSIRK